MHCTNNLTAEENKYHLLNRLHFQYHLSVLEKGRHHDFHSPGAMNTQKFESPFGLDKFLPDLAYVREITKETIWYVCT
jgi:hypothetical protein